MDKVEVFAYIPLIKPDCDDANTATISDEALEAKWRVIDYILKKIILKTD
ncbi:hypothetical protein J2T12_003538 [Paenibacillus anaericanus]|nr:hypothetical protein [Paenibacillus anaericanus]MDQ0090124.1 hypothetical protein [Paenibacillus anaericanus]